MTVVSQVASIPKLTPYLVSVNRNMGGLRQSSGMWKTLVALPGVTLFVSSEISHSIIIHADILDFMKMTSHIGLSPQLSVKLRRSGQSDHSTLNPCGKQ